MNTSRIIMHIDFNSYFASVEQQANPFLRGKAIGVGGKPGTRSIVATASIEAKRQGVKTAMSSSEATRLLPELQMIDGDARKYSEMTDRFMNIYKRHADVVEQFSVDEAFLDVTEQCEDWMDAIAIALRIREDIKNEIGSYTTASIGIAPNKLVAKIASESDKPHGMTVVYPDEVEAFLDERELSDVPGIGFAILRRLEEMGISSITQLREAPLSTLASFKQYGHFLYNVPRGIDHSRVSDVQEVPKSVGHSYTLPFDTSSPTVLRATLLHLADKVAWRLRKHGLVARSFSAVVRFESMSFKGSMGKFDAPTNEGLKIFNGAWTKVSPLLHSDKIRLVGVSARDLVPVHEQVSSDAGEQKRTKLLPALDKIQHRYGSGSWLRASELLAVKLKERTNGFFFDHVGESSEAY
ncbi:DNA polymerase IV [Candidatus Uhrbacteria bacterium]|nr:DNA polymerase IV [Candidatus Uhrbacteria bacterium]